MCHCFIGGTDLYLTMDDSRLEAILKKRELIIVTYQNKMRSHYHRHAEYLC